MALELDPRRVVERALSFPPQPDELQRIGDVGGSSSSLRLASGTLDGSVDDTGDASGSGAGLGGGGGTKGAGWGAGSLRARRGQSLSADRLMRAHVGALWSRAARESILRHRHINYADLLRTASTTDAKIVLDVDRTSSSMRFGMSVSPSPAAKGTMACLCAAGAIWRSAAHPSSAWGCLLCCVAFCSQGPRLGAGTAACAALCGRGGYRDRVLPRHEFRRPNAGA